MPQLFKKRNSGHLTYLLFLANIFFLEIHDSLILASETLKNHMSNVRVIQLCLIKEAHGRIESHSLPLAK